MSNERGKRENDSIPIDKSVFCKCFFFFLNLPETHDICVVKVKCMVATWIHLAVALPTHNLCTYVRVYTVGACVFFVDIAGSQGP